MQHIEINEFFARALKLLEETNQHLFITGRAGTGKSTLLEYFRANTKKNIAVLAPTGVAAVNVKGQTIHSFFGFKPHTTTSEIKKLSKDKQKMYQHLDTIVIDEISMVRADLLDCVDIFLRANGPHKKKPFGGIQIVAIGDLYQLPPVVTSAEKHIFSKQYSSPYFFSAKVFDNETIDLFGERQNFEIVFLELEKIYRQSDPQFIALLNGIRNKTITDEDINSINCRVGVQLTQDDQKLPITLTTTNDMARIVNDTHLSTTSGKKYNFKGMASGEFEEKSFPTEMLLTLKEGAQIMLLNNDTQKRWINGTMGKVKKINSSDNCIIVQLDSGLAVDVVPFEWTMHRYIYDADNKQLTSKSVGSFTQFPLKLAWAVTIHKSQGKTFQHVVLDIGRGTFSPGQLYVALSRCVSFEGLSLIRPIAKKHIWLDPAVMRFLTKLQYDIAEQDIPLHDKIQLIEQAIHEKRTLQITYLKTNDEKTRRKIQPHYIGTCEYVSKKFLGVKAFCLERNDDRVFRVDRILEIAYI